MDGRAGAWVGGWTDGCGWMGVWMDGWVGDGWVKGFKLIYTPSKANNR